MEDAVDAAIELEYHAADDADTAGKADAAGGGAPCCRGPGREEGEEATRAQEALQHQEDEGTAEEGTGGGRRREAGINENKQQSAKDVERHCAAAGERTMILEGGRWK